MDYTDEELALFNFYEMVIFEYIYKTEKPLRVNIYIDYLIQYHYKNGANPELVADNLIKVQESIKKEILNG